LVLDIISINFRKTKKFSLYIFYNFLSKNQGVNPSEKQILSYKYTLVKYKKEFNKKIGFLPIKKGTKY